MRLRTRLALSVVVAALPAVAALAWSRSRFEQRTLDVAMRDYVLTRITVVGERWWWRVFYTDPEGRKIETANELRIPAGRPVALELTTNDVIHSFWVPRLAGKLDMIPGRVNVLTVEAREPGISRGQCAEYCGGAHALMSFYVVAMPEAEFQAWLAAERECRA